MSPQSDMPKAPLRAFRAFGDPGRARTPEATAGASGTGRLENQRSSAAAGQVSLGCFGEFSGLTLGIRRSAVVVQERER